MLKTSIATGMIAGALLFAPLPPSPAQAFPGVKPAELGTQGVTEVRRRGAHGFRGGRHFGGHRFHGGRHFGFRRFHGGRHFGHRRFHRRHFHFRPFVYGGFYYYGRSCRWLRWRAIETGSPYWWRRYHLCRRGWY
jgi:hypothetical protein